MIRITFGALADPIRKQVPKLSPKDALHFQRDADAITRLLIRGVLSDGEGRRARKRLVNMIATANVELARVSRGEMAQKGVLL